jgi:hypothetical protein
VRSTARVRIAAAATGLAALGLLSGCGLTDDGDVRPGVAAEVGDESVSLDEVDDVAEELCDVRGEDPTTIGTAISGAELRARALQTLVLREITDGLAEEYDVTPSRSFDALEKSADEAGTYQAKVTVGISYLVEVMQTIGKEKAGAGASEEEQLAAGIEAAQEWTEREGIRTNPLFPRLEIGDQAVEFTRDDDVSVAVSSFAEDALADADALDAQQPDSDYAESLPESQRCGGPCTTSSAATTPSRSSSR